MNRFTLPLMIAFCLLAALAQAQSMEKFAQFVPDHVQSLVVVQVDKILQDPGANWMLDQEVLDKYLPAELGKVERLVFAGTPDDLMYLQYSVAGTFDDIAHELLGETEPRPKTTRAHRLNRDFVALIQFQSPVDDQAIIQWLNEGSENSLDYKTNVSALNGFDVLSSSHENVCSVARLDDRTIVLGGAAMMARPLGDIDDSRGGLISHWNERLWNSNFVALINVPELVDHLGPNTVPIENLAQAEWISIEMNFQGSHLFRAEAKFQKEKDASLALTALRGFFSDQLEAANQAIESQKQHLSESDLWLVKKTMGIMKTVEFDQQDNLLMAEIPMPDQWVKVVEEYAEQVRRAEAQMRAEYDAIARDLDAATEAALEAASDSIQDLRDE